MWTSIVEKSACGLENDPNAQTLRLPGKSRSFPPMKELLARLKQAEPSTADRVCILGECEKSLARACRLVGITRITHHACGTFSLRVASRQEWTFRRCRGGWVMWTEAPWQCGPMATFGASTARPWRSV